MAETKQAFMSGAFAFMTEFGAALLEEEFKWLDERREEFDNYVPGPKH